MQYFVASDDAAIASQIRATLVELRHECPSSNVVRLDLAVSMLSAPVPAPSRAPVVGSSESEHIVFVVLAPDPVKALAAVRDIRLRTTARVLAVGQATDTKLVLRTMREGASEYLDQGELKAELTDALQRLDASVTSGRIIAVLAPGGGSGASTVCVNVATALAQKYHTAALIDLKLEAGDLAPLLDLKPNHTLSELCQQIERMDYSLLHACLTRCDSGVHLLAAPSLIADVPLVTADAVNAILQLVRRHFSFVVLDVDHTFQPEQTRALVLADVIALILRLDFISLRNARTTLDFLQLVGVSRDKVRIVANRFGEPGQLSAAQAEDSLGIKISQLIPDEPKIVNRANNDGMPVILQSPSAKVSRSLIQLATILAEFANTSG